MINFDLLKDLIVAVAAFVGMGLSFFNFFRERRKEKVRLRVIPKSVVQKALNSRGEEYVKTSADEFDPNENAGLVAIEVINLNPRVTDEGCMPSG